MRGQLQIAERGQPADAGEHAVEEQQGVPLGVGDDLEDRVAMLLLALRQRIVALAAVDAAWPPG